MCPNKGIGNWGGGVSRLQYPGSISRSEAVNGGACGSKDNDTLAEDDGKIEIVTFRNSCEKENVSSEVEGINTNNHMNLDKMVNLSNDNSLTRDNDDVIDQTEAEARSKFIFRFSSNQNCSFIFIFSSDLLFFHLLIQ